MNPERTLLCAGGPVDGWRIPVNRPELLIDLYKVGRHRYVVHTMARGNEMEDVLFYAGEVKGPKMPQEKEADMQTYRYEIVAPDVKDKDGNVVVGKEAIRIAHGDGLLVEPSKLSLLQRHHAEIVKAGREYGEVTVSVCPFCG